MDSEPREFKQLIQPWYFRQRTLLIALSLSVFAHVAAYVASHELALPWRMATAAVEFGSEQAFDAVLMPTAKLVAPSVVTKVAVSRTIGKRALRGVQKSSANFVAPENAIAVATATAITTTAGVVAQNSPATDTADEENSTAISPVANSVSAWPANDTKLQPVAGAETAKSLALPKGEMLAVAETAPAAVFPERVSMAYRISSSIADGVANFSWRRNGTNGTHYELDSTIQATGIFAGLFVGTFLQTSRGEITPDGIRPAFFSLRRGDSPADTAEFNRDKLELKMLKHGEIHLLPLPPQLQDTQSFLFQLAQDARQLKRSGDRIKIVLTNARKVYHYEFHLLGEETLQTRMGAVATLHMKSDAADPEDVYEVWLSPGHFYLPVKMKFYMGRFLVEQTVSSISASDQ